MTTDKPTTTASDYAKAMSDKSAQPENAQHCECGKTTDNANTDSRSVATGTAHLQNYPV